MSFFTDSSLCLIPSGVKSGKVYSIVPTSGDGDLTFSRASNATRVNSSGLVEKVRTNELTYSNDFSNAAWVVLNSPTLTANYAANPIDGANDAWRFQAANDNDRIYQNFSGSFLNFSIYAKGTGTLRLRDNVGVYTDVTLTASWQRISVHFPSSVSNVQITTGTSCDAVIYAAQLEQGDIATDYIATTTTAVSVGPVSGLPRLDYSGGASCGKLLLEGQRTNLVAFSEQFNNAPWSQIRATITANQTLSPDGTTSADLYTDGTFTNQFGYSDTPVITTIGTAYTYSIFVKAGTSPFLFLGLYDTQDNGVLFNTATNATTTFGSVSNVNVQSYGSGWYRVSFTRVASATTSYAGISVRPTNSTANYNGTSSLTAYFWGAQVEAGSYASSYIPTLSTAVTRVAESAYKDSLSVFGTNEGSFFVDAEGPSPAYSGSAEYLFDLSDNSSDDDNRFAMYSGGVNSMRLYTNASNSFTISASNRKKILVIWNGTNTKVYANGAKVLDITYANANPTSINLNSRFTDANYGNSKFNQVLAFPTALSDADAITLTTI